MYRCRLYVRHDYIHSLISLFCYTGLVVDGADGTDIPDNPDLGIDVDYTSDTTTVTVQFDGFESQLHGVMRYEWAVGTTPGGEDVQPFMSEGIIHSEEDSVAGDGKSFSPCQ